MSESDNPSPPKPPTIKTSAVPLKKETVRITLRPSAPASEPLPAVPPPPPTAKAPTGVPRPTGPSTSPTVNLGAAPPPPSGPRPNSPAPTGAPTIPLRSAPPMVRPTTGAPPPPTRPVGGGAPPPPGPAATGSKTIPLAAPPAAARPLAPPSRPTSSAPGGTPATQPLPKATVKLQKPGGPAGPPTGPPTGSVSAAPIKGRFDEEEEEEIDEGPLNIAAIIGVVSAIAALVIAAMSWEKMPGDAFIEPPLEPAESESWLASPRDEQATKLPVDHNPFHVHNEGDDTWTNDFEKIKASRVSIPELVES